MFYHIAISRSYRMYLRKFDYHANYMNPLDIIILIRMKDNLHDNIFTLKGTPELYH
jgi:hypothetical protein